AGQRVEVVRLDATGARLDLAQHPVDRHVERCRHATAGAPADDLAGHGGDLDWAADLQIPPGDRLDAPGVVAHGRPPRRERGAPEVVANGRQRLLERVAPAGAAAGDEGRWNEAEEVLEPHALRGGDVDSLGRDLGEQPRVRGDEVTEEEAADRADDGHGVDEELAPQRADDVVRRAGGEGASQELRDPAEALVTASVEATDDEIAG